MAPRPQNAFNAKKKPKTTVITHPVNPTDQAYPAYLRGSATVLLTPSQTTRVTWYHVLKNACEDTLRHIAVEKQSRRNTAISTS